MQPFAEELATLGATVVIASRDVDKCTVAAIDMNKEIERCRKRASCGRVVVGPSTSIRDEEQVNDLVSYIMVVHI